LPFALFLLALPGAVCCPAAVPGATCDSLAAMKLAHGTVVLATAVAAGAFAPVRTGPVAAGGGENFRNLPAFCRVGAVLKPVAGSEIRIEVWLPAAGWNRKLQAIGNGGWAGSISYSGLAAPLLAGYAAATTDTGHSGADARFALDHPEQLIDFGYRAIHEMTLAAKSILAAYYADPPQSAYFNGCSTGGRQALTEAQRYPGDYDGIVAGAPANYTSHMTPQQMWIAQAVHQDETSYIPPDKYPAIHQAALQQCDALDGVRDGVIEDPTRCHFDPAALLCKADDGHACLNAPQVEAAKKIYAGPRNPRTGTQVFPGLEPGSEAGWAGLGGAQPFAYGADVLRYVVFGDPAWNYRTLDFDSGVALADRKAGGVMNATDPNLKPFFAHGGKLLMYHGWSDPLIAPGNSVNYYRSVLKALGTRAAASVRLFMVPGMGHCRGGDGTDGFDMIPVLDDWIAKARPPEQIAASHKTSGAVVRTRPLCAWPKVAAYNGSGSTDDAANFTCRAN
jgi:feruloyl esterase